MWGDDVPAPFLNFEDLSIPKKLLKNVAELGISEPTPVQMQSIPVMLQHRDLLVSAPTGSGKTLAFALPILKMASEENLEPKQLFSVIVAPTSVLAQQVRFYPDSHALFRVRTSFYTYV